MKHAKIKWNVIAKKMGKMQLKNYGTQTQFTFWILWFFAMCFMETQFLSAGFNFQLVNWMG